MMIPRAAVLAAVVVSVTVAGCSSPQSEAEPIPSPVVETQAPLTGVPTGSADWECGAASALIGIQFRTDWEAANGVIDANALAARSAALQDAWALAPFGNSDVTDALRTVIDLAETAGLDSEDFRSATQQLVNACDAAGSIVVLSALPGMGG